MLLLSSSVTVYFVRIEPTFHSLYIDKNEIFTVGLGKAPEINIKNYLVLFWGEKDRANVICR